MKLDYYLSKHPELKALYDLVRSDYFTRGLVHHNWNHVLRVLARGIEIGEREEANMRIVLASLLLHDTGDFTWKKILIIILLEQKWLQASFEKQVSLEARSTTLCIAFVLMGLADWKSLGPLKPKYVMM